MHGRENSAWWATPFKWFDHHNLSNCDVSRLYFILLICPDRIQNQINPLTTCPISYHVCWGRGHLGTEVAWFYVNFCGLWVLPGQQELKHWLSKDVRVIHWRGPGTFFFDESAVVSNNVISFYLNLLASAIVSDPTFKCNCMECVFKKVKPYYRLLPLITAYYRSSSTEYLRNI